MLFVSSASDMRFSTARASLIAVVDDCRSRQSWVNGSLEMNRIVMMRPTSVAAPARPITSFRWRTGRSCDSTAPSEGGLLGLSHPLRANTNRIAGSTVNVVNHVRVMPTPAIAPNCRNPRKSVISSDVYATPAVAVAASVPRIAPPIARVIAALASGRSAPPAAGDRSSSWNRATRTSPALIPLPTTIANRNAVITLR
jgi:hypothetical protein